MSIELFYKYYNKIQKFDTYAPFVPLVLDEIFMDLVGVSCTQLLKLFCIYLCLLLCPIAIFHQKILF